MIDHVNGHNGHSNGHNGHSNGITDDLSSLASVMPLLPIRAQTGDRRAGERFDYLIVGAGFAGSVLAERLASQDGKKVLIVDKYPHIGGNAYDHYDDAGILVHKYGPHIFH